MQVDLTYCELRKGDTVLLCSDGLSGMVRFDDIREVLKTTGDPLEACKELTERANQAGGHDNITVIVVHFDGDAIPPLGESPEPVRYRKYVLPEETSANVESHRRLLPELPPASGSGVQAAASGGAVPQGLGSTMVFAGTPQAPAPAAAPNAARPPVNLAYLDEERIEIPGTHVPAWIVVVLVVGVILILAGTSFLFLR